MDIRKAFDSVSHEAIRDKHQPGPGSDTGGQEEYDFTIGTIVLNQMAYAADLILFTISPEEMQKRLDQLAVSLGRLGLELNAQKCCVLSIHGDKKRKFSFVDTDVSISVEANRLPVMTAKSEFCYLGVQFNWKSIAQTSLDLEKLLVRLNHAALKPQQNLIILKRFLLLCLQHQLTFVRLSAKRTKQFVGPSASGFGCRQTVPIL